MIAYEDRPGLAAHRTVLDILLHGAAAGVERDRDLLGAVGTDDGCLGVDGSVAKGELLVEVAEGIAVADRLEIIVHRHVEIRENDEKHT